MKFVQFAMGVVMISTVPVGSTSADAPRLAPRLRRSVLRLGPDGEWLGQYWSTAFDLTPAGGDWARRIVVRPDSRVVTAGRVQTSGLDLEFDVAKQATDVVLTDGFESPGRRGANWNRSENGATVIDTEDPPCQTVPRKCDSVTILQRVRRGESVSWGNRTFGAGQRQTRSESFSSTC